MDLESNNTQRSTSIFHAKFTSIALISFAYKFHSSIINTTVLRAITTIPLNTQWIISSVGQFHVSFSAYLSFFYERIGVGIIQIVQWCVHTNFIDYNVSLFAFIKRAALYCDEYSEVPGEAAL